MDPLFGESSFLTDNNKDVHIPPTSKTIPAGLSENIRIRIESKNVQLYWEFETKSYDIQFGIKQESVKEGKGSSSFLLPLSSYKPNQKHSGSILLEEPGMIEVLWDNSHSWLREKHIEYKLDTVKLEMTASEKSAYNKRLFEAIVAHTNTLNTLNSQITEMQDQKKMVLQEHEAKLAQMETIQQSICACDTSIAEAEELIHSLNNEENEIQSKSHHVHISAPFLLEGERIFSFLTGVDLLKLCCVNRLLHDGVYQDGVWKRVFYQEEPEQLKAVFQNEHLRTMYQLVNPEPITCGEKVNNPTKEGDSGEIIQKNDMAEKGSPEFLKDLSLLYKITEKQGWYKNKNNECYFIRFKDNTKKNFDVIFSAIPSSELDTLIRQTLKSTVLIPMPGTEAGKSGFYIDRFRRVSKWSVESIETENGNTLKWQEVQY